MADVWEITIRATGDRDTVLDYMEYVTEQMRNDMTSGYVTRGMNWDMDHVGEV